MYVAFESLPSTSRIWIYQANAEMDSAAIDKISGYLKDYCERWAAHGHALRASFEIRFNYFIILAVDESYNATSGCSIDNSVRAIKEIERFTRLDFFNRQLVAFKKNDNILVYHLSSLKEKLGSGMWNGEMLTFNNLITEKAQLETAWIIPASQTWLKRYLVAKSVSL